MWFFFTKFNLENESFELKIRLEIRKSWKLKKLKIRKKWKKKKNISRDNETIYPQYLKDISTTFWQLVHDILVYLHIFVRMSTIYSQNDISSILATYREFFRKKILPPYISSVHAWANIFESNFFHP